MPTREELLSTLTPADRKTVEESGYDLGLFEDGSVGLKIHCRRCGGTGQYSHCEAYQSRCFDCDVRTDGKLIGFEWVAAAKWAKNKRASNRRVEKAAAKWESERVQREQQAAEFSRHEAERLAKIEAEKVERQNNQQWVGKIGDKIEVEGVLKFSKYFPPQNRGWSGRTLNVFIVEGNSVVHWYSGNAEFSEDEKGKSFKIRGTVKEHTIYEKTGDKQTILTRAKYE